MHQELTFTCNLNEPEKWQPICSEVKYGTHYLIYAKFTAKEKKGKCEVEKIDLWLQNYTGAVTMGIANASIPEWGTTRDGASEMFILTVKVKALLFNPGFEIKVPKGKLVLGKKDELETNVFVVKNDNPVLLDNTNRDTRNRAIFVDEEFYIRDGEDINERLSIRGDRNCRAIRSTFYF